MIPAPNNNMPDALVSHVPGFVGAARNHCDSNEQLVDWPTLFERQCELTPAQTAIVFEDESVTYDELNQLSNRIAHYLLDSEVVPEQRIGICLDRSIAAIAAMFGILKAGAAFVPLDPEFPADRLEYMIDDADISHVICDETYKSILPSSVSIVTPGEDKWSRDIANPDISIAPDQLAYIMYTSGSTGRPKGVQIEHRALAAYSYADASEYELQSTDRTLQFSTLNFDIAIEEIYPPLLTGSTVVVRPRNRSDAQNELSDIVEKFDVTAIHLATAYWHEWVDLMRATGARVPESIRLMVVTGEKVSTEHFRRWLTLCDHEVQWFNAYGPTEATVTSTIFKPSADWQGDNMPIGKPLKRYTAHILDAELKPVGKDQTGELFIGGPGLARGYLNRPDLTEKAFVRWNSPTGEVTIYKTGDLARWLPNGDIEFAGRIDHQIKLGSYRIEPGEIEAALNQHPATLESLITFDSIDGKKFLIAYVAHGDNDVTVDELFGHLKENLPAYMVPVRYLLLESFPKTINGKIDRKALPSPASSVVAGAGNYVAPRTELEKELAEIWTEVLNVPQVGIHDDFFSLGGSSLLVTRVITRLSSQLNQEIPVRDFFANPTVASIARHIGRLNQSDQASTDDEHEISRAIRATLPRIQPQFFQSGDASLFGVHYAPVKNKTSHAVVICPSYGHEYARAHRNLQQLGVQLARQGCDVLRFDYAGTGNSTGDEQTSTTDDWIGNIRDATSFTRELTDCERISVIGIRLGATLLSNCDNLNVDLRIYWDPVCHGKQYCEWLEDIHNNTLRNLTRFPVTRKASATPQAFGFELPKSRKQNLSNLKLAEPGFGCKTALLSSEGYERAEFAGQPGNGWTHQWHVVDTRDAIYWHEPTYTERAFSSPESFEAICCLVGESQ